MQLITRITNRLRKSFLPAPRRLFYRQPQTFSVNAQELAFINHVKQCIEAANTNKTKLSPEIFTIDGMSSPKVRTFLNNLCSLAHCNYLEIGCLKGSTFISALYENKNIGDATAVDNWSEFGGTQDEFLKNINRFLPRPPYRFEVYEQDCFTLNKAQIFKKPVNVYFYDGAHDADAQEKAFTYFNDILDDVFITIVDDWNWDDARRGTFKAFKKLGYEILFEQELQSRHFADMEQWYCGLYVAVIRKPAKR